MCRVDERPVGAGARPYPQFIVSPTIDARTGLQQITNCRLLLVGRERRRIVVYAETANGRVQGD